ncbi:phage envelope protein [Staphylococcus aureus]|uniref:Phage envelope protein n=1 Tax=Staphylococcus aureus TaxID=1280 RepID=A0A380DJP9_STAAU|nr:phage envelope protein [Staphylococcus aureus]
MAFTLSEIQQAHQQFTGVDFPKLFKAFKDMGMTYNIVNIQDGTATYVHQSEDDIVTSSVKVIILSLQVQINLSFKMY